MGFLELAQMATFQDQGFALDLRQGANDLEAVARSLQDEEVPLGGILLRPGFELAHRYFVIGLLDDRFGRRATLEDRGGEAIRVGVKANHSLDIIWFSVHFIARMCRRTETGLASTCTQVCGAVPM